MEDHYNAFFDLTCLSTAGESTAQEIKYFMKAKDRHVRALVFL